MVTNKVKVRQWTQKERKKERKKEVLELLGTEV
jgi:hypothetical protein